MIGKSFATFRQSATFIVAASDSLYTERADYVCDGVDDQVEIQAAIDALPNTGGKIVLLEGTYNAHSLNLHGTSNNKNNVEFVGVGWSAIIKLPSMTRKNVLEADGIEGLRIANLQIDGNYTNQNMADWSMRELATNGCTAGVCEILMNNIYIQKSSRVTVENVYSHSSPHPAILFHDGVEKSMVRNCYVKNVQWNGIEFWNGGELSSITGCYSEDNYGTGIIIELNGDRKVSIVGNVLVDTDGTHGQTGIDSTLEYTTIVGNFVYQQRISISGDHNIVANNIIHVNNRETHGIRVDGKYNQVIGNNIYYPYHSAIQIEDDYNLISGNMLLNGGIYSIGIRLMASADYNKLVNNIIKDFAHYPAIDEISGGDYNEVFDNSIINCAGGTIVLTGANSKARRNLGYVTKNSGSSTGIGAQQTIAHGLAAIPTKVILWNIEDGANPYQSAVADPANIYITGVLNQDYGWQAEVV